jgi:hypothetical protein
VYAGFNYKTKSEREIVPLEVLTIENLCNVNQFSTSCKILIDFLPSYKENIFRANSLKKKYKE